MATFQLVQGGICVNTLLFDDSATLANNAITLPDSSVMSPPTGATFMNQSGAGIRWTLSGGVLVAPTPAPVTYTIEQLTIFANSFQWALATGGHTLTVEGAPLLFPTDVNSLSLMTGKAVRLQLPGAPTSIDWQLPSGYVTISATDFITAAASLADWMQSTFEALKPVLALIQSGAITTPAQIVASTWPAA